MTRAPYPILQLSYGYTTVNPNSAAAASTPLCLLPLAKAASRESCSHLGRVVAATIDTLHFGVECALPHLCPSKSLMTPLHSMSSPPSPRLTPVPPQSSMGLLRSGIFGHGYGVGGGAQGANFTGGGKYARELKSSGRRSSNHVQVRRSGQALPSLYFGFLEIWAASGFSWAFSS